MRLWGDTMRFNPSQPSEDLKTKIKKYILHYVKAAEVDHERELEKLIVRLILYLKSGKI